MKNRVFQKYLIWAIASLVIFFIAGTYFNIFLAKLMQPKQKEFVMPPPVFFAKVLDQGDPRERVLRLQQLYAGSENLPMPRVILVDEAGQTYFPANAPIPFNWSTAPKPASPYASTEVKIKNSSAVPPSPFSMVDPRQAVGLGGPQGPSYGGSAFIIRLAGDSKMYLITMAPAPPPPSPSQPNISNSEVVGPPGPGEMGPPPGPPLLGLASMIVALILGISFAFAVIYLSINRQVRIADTVISELQSGNLKARFPTQRRDEFGQAALRFNTMAAEIEKLVENLKRVEQSRTLFLQELAHDLRTPIASMKNFLETLHFKSEKIDVKMRQELVLLSMNEVDYFERLVEDLLFLSQVEDPGYHQQKQSISIHEIIKDEISKAQARQELQDRPIVIEFVFQSPLDQVFADEHLIRRMIRNGIENALGHSQSKLKIQTQLLENKKLSIDILDDGKGFSAEGLKQFGERRPSRKVERDLNGKLSVGLGSVVMKTLCHLYKGEMKVQNRRGPNGETLGAQLSLIVPLDS